MMGFAGQLSLGHALYVGLGAYTTAALYVHFGIGPWIGLPAAILISVACGADHRLSGVPLRRRRRLFRDPDHRVRRIRAHRLRPLRLGRRLGRPVPAGRATTRRNDLSNLRGQPVMFYYVILALTALALRALPRAAAQPRRLLLAGDPRGRAGGARARHRHLPLQDGRGRDLGRHDGARPACSTRSTTTTCFPSRCSSSRARSRSSSARSSAASARCSGRCSARSCSPGLSEALQELLHAPRHRRARRQAGVLRHLPAAGGDGPAGRHLAADRAAACASDARETPEA